MQNSFVWLHAHRDIRYVAFVINSQPLPAPLTHSSDKCGALLASQNWMIAQLSYLTANTKEKQQTLGLPEMAVQQRAIALLRAL